MYGYCNMRWDRRRGNPEYLFLGYSQNEENSPFTPLDLALPRLNHPRVQPPLPILSSATPPCSLSFRGIAPLSQLALSSFPPPLGKHAAVDQNELSSRKVAPYPDWRSCVAFIPSMHTPASCSRCRLTVSGHHHGAPPCRHGSFPRAVMRDTGGIGG